MGQGKSGVKIAKLMAADRGKKWGLSEKPIGSIGNLSDVIKWPIGGYRQAIGI
jgi:hypothetical protein